MSSPRRAILKALFATLALTLSAPWAQAQRPTDVRVKVGQSVDVTLPRKPMLINCEDTAICTVTVTNGKARVTGKKVGRTQIVGRDDGNRPFAPIPVTVE